MDKFRPIFRIAAFPLLILATLLAGWGCDGSSSTVGVTTPGYYTITSGLVNDANRDIMSIGVDVIRDDSTLATATISLGDDTLVFVDPFYKLVKGPAVLYTYGEIEYTIRDGGVYALTVKDTLPDTFSIGQVMPDRREKLSAESVNLSWTGAAGADGYVIASTKKERAYSGDGYSHFVTSQTTSMTYPPEAFTVDHDPANEIDPGWYYLYVYAFSGAPDSALTSAYLPVPLPSQIEDNLSGRDYEGRFGTVTVIESDSMHVIAE